MSYICYFENSNISSNKKEFLYIQENQLVGTYNPEQAETFNSQKDAEEWVSKFIHRGEDVFYTNEIESELIKFNNWMNKPIYRIQPLISEHSYKKTDETPEEIFNWWVQYHRITNEKSGAFRFEDYQTWNICGAFQNIESTETHINNETKKRSLSVTMAVDTNDCFNTFKAELSLALNFVTLTDEDTNALIITITDYELCERDQYYLYVYPDNTYVIDDYHCSEDTPKTLEEIFEYWKKQRPKTKQIEDDDIF